MERLYFKLNDETRFLSDINELANFNWNQRVLLVSTTGTGKTTLFEKYALTTKEHKGVIICEPNQGTVLMKCEGHPNFGQWLEAESRTNDKRDGKVIYSTYDSFVSNYKNLKDHDQYLVVFDESHNISDLVGFRFNGFGLLDFLSTSTQYVFMTGTPRDEINLFEFDTFINVKNVNYVNRTLHFLRTNKDTHYGKLIEQYINIMKPDNIIIYKQSKNDNFDIAAKIELMFPTYRFTVSHRNEKDKRILTKQQFKHGDSIATTSWLREGVDIYTDNYNARVLMFAFDGGMSAESPSTLIQLSERIRNPKSIDIVYFNDKDRTIISNPKFNDDNVIEYNAELYTKCYDIVDSNNETFNWSSDKIIELIKSWGWRVIKTTPKTINDIENKSYYNEISERIIEQDFDTPFFSCGNVVLSLKDFGLNCNNLSIWPPYDTIKQLYNSKLTNSIDEVKNLEYVCNDVNIDYFDYVKHKIVDSLLKLNNMGFGDVNYKIKNPECYSDVTYTKITSVYTSKDDFYDLCKCNIFTVNKYKHDCCEFDVNIEYNYKCENLNKVFTNVKRIENYVNNCEYIATMFEVPNGRYNTVMDDCEMNDLMRIQIQTTIKMPWYVPTLEIVDEDVYFSMMVANMQKYIGSPAGEIIKNWCVNGLNHSHDFAAYYNRYMDIVSNLDDINIASFINVNTLYDVDNIFDGYVYGDTDAYEMYRIMFAIDNADKNSAKYNFQTPRKDKGSSHKPRKAHAYEYFIDDVRFEFSGKLDELIDKLKTEIEGCPKAKDTIKKRYNIKKIG